MRNKRSMPTIVEQAILSVDGFEKIYKTFEQQVILKGQSKSTLHNYIRRIALISLHFGTLPEFVSDDEINELLTSLALDPKSPSRSSFKHAVYGLRYYFRMIGQTKRAIALPSLKRDTKLPIILNQTELRQLFIAPTLLKHRIVLTLIYSAGLRGQEVINFKISDIDFRQIEKLSKENLNFGCFYVNQSVCFINCTFNGKVIFSGLNGDKAFVKSCFMKGLTFKNCIFKNEVIASNCEYRGVADFSNSIFENKADFSGSYFANKDAFFSDISFNGEVQFSNSLFNGNVSFMKTFFKGNTFFQNTIIRGNAMFANSIFAAYTDFSNAGFFGITNFNYAEFKETVLVNYVRFNGRVDFIKTIFKTKTEIKDCEFHSICRFNETEFYGKTIIENNVFVCCSPEVKGLTADDKFDFTFTNNTEMNGKEVERFVFLVTPN